MNKIVFFIGLIGIAIGTLGINLVQDEALIVFFDNVHWTLSIGAAAVLSGLGYMRNRLSPSSKSALWFFIGFTGYFIGHLIWDIQTFFSYSGFPSPSDLFYLWLGPGVTIALYHQIDLHKDKVSKATFLLDLSALSTAALTLILISYLPRGGNIDILSMSVLVSYPITLIIPVIMVTLMIVSMRLSINLNLSLFFLGIAITGLSWMHWNSMALDGLISNGSWFNITFSIAILMGGLAVSNWHLVFSQNQRCHYFNEALLRILPIITVVLSSLAVIIVGSDSSFTSLIKQLVYFGAGIVIIIAIIRQSHLLYDKEILQKETLDRLTLATLHNGIGIWDWNLQTMELVWDDSMFALYNMRREDFSGAVDAWEKSLHPDDKERSEEEIRITLSGGKPFDTEFRVIWPNGEIHYIKAVAKTFFDDNGKPLRMLGTNIDISKLRMAEKELAKKEKLLILQSRHAAMGEMISMIAHQWRQPLSILSVIAMKIQAKIGLGQLKLEDQDQKYLLEQMDSIHLYTQNLSTTIDDFRNFYKPNKSSESVKLEEACRKSLAIIKTSLINQNINIIEEYSSQDKVEVYTNEMIQVILNILKNAQDNFIEKGTKEPYIRISTNNKTLSICDNGGGIPEDIIDRIFDPYFSTKNEKNGTGLGLYMSKTIIEDHHKGKLEAKNTDDGVCFNLLFK